MEMLSRNLESASEKFTAGRHGGVAVALRLGWYGLRDPDPDANALDIGVAGTNGRLSVAVN